MSTPTPSRSGADRCPGLLTPFVSADGAMVRLRIPGGRVDASTLREISSLAQRFGNPDITLTSRGSLQLRGLPDPLPRELITAIGDLGLVPSGPHDKARNIVADPHAGLDDLVTALDEGLLADPGLAGLPGRFLLAVASPGGPVLAEPWDVAVVAEPGEGGIAQVVADGRAISVPRDEAAEAALDVARRFLAARTDTRTWNLRDLPDEARADLLPGGAPFDVVAGGPPSPGPVGDDLVALVPLGLLTPAMAAALEGTLRITPWRSVVVPGGAARAAELAAAGFATTADSPWTVLTACAGAPSCGRTTTRTRDLATEAAPFVDVTGPVVHVIGCERSCGHPARAHATALNPTSAADVVAAQHEKA
ncbi:cobalamin biosynthesis protein CobG [Janibacter sp. G349]|uniref:cobalamin biosynthesis protein CobG n=1 Tax=Janibacter sp. G349 TaxID=3405424 RepID=UPI003B7983D7